VSTDHLLLRALLFSSDVQVIATLSHLIDGQGIRVDVAMDPSSARDKLARSKFEALVIDFRLKNEAMGLLNHLHRMKSHEQAVVLGILESENDTLGAFRAGANFVLLRPLSPTAIVRTLKAAHPLMVRERRRCFRSPLQVPVHICTRSGKELVATSLNISEGGISVTLPTGLPIGQTVQIRFVLPGTDKELEIEAEVCWADNSGSLGLQFGKLTSDVDEELQSWFSNLFQTALVH
jgi:DNA-binding response OmpR family regulator